MLNYYKILNINFDASDIEIRRQYLRMAKKYHPDKGGNCELFNLIKMAYDEIVRQRKICIHEQIVFYDIMEDYKLSDNMIENFYKYYLENRDLNINRDCEYISEFIIHNFHKFFFTRKNIFDIIYNFFS